MNNLCLVVLDVVLFNCMFLKYVIIDLSKWKYFIEKMNENFVKFEIDMEMCFFLFCYFVLIDDLRFVFI